MFFIPTMKKVSLKPYNTFGIAVNAQYLIDFDSVNTLRVLRKAYQHLPQLLIGEGSNVLFLQDFEGLILRNAIKGIELIGTWTNDKGEQISTIRVGSGENWHKFVLYCLENNYFGLENLSLIPGTVGASPMQNIGAYGVEVKDFIREVTALHLDSNEIHIISNKDCQFGYRSSIFKGEQKGAYAILSVTFDLLTEPKLRLAYGDITKTLETMGVTTPTAQEVSRAIVQIRTNKLPNPAEIGNAGSFFKNPEIFRAMCERLQQHFPNLPAYPSEQTDMVKIPAGWLIEQAGWKGYRAGDAGVHHKQALVLVNYGKATGSEIWELAKAIMLDVESKFGIILTPEVNVIE